MESEFQTIYPRCAFLDVHKQTVEAPARVLEGERVRQQTRRWGTLTDELRAMADWLETQGITHVGMESTGVFWKPIYNILESRFTVILVNARHLKQVKGRKSDVRDSQWGAQLLQFGLLRPSFIPPRWQRELRDLTRHRTQLVAEQTRVANRMHKELEDANVKLGSVATDILGVSGRAIIHALMEGEKDATRLANMAQGKLRNKIPELQRALQGGVTDHHRFMLRLLWDELEALEELMAQLEKRIAEVTAPYAFPDRADGPGAGSRSPGGRGGAGRGGTGPQTVSQRRPSLFVERNVSG